jgi:mono/diheme cytochrome c family protein
MKRRLALFVATVLVAVSLTAGVEIIESSNKLCAATAKMSFADDILPIFKGYCFTCHQPGQQGSEKSGLDLSTYEGVMRGTKFGKMVLPGDPEGSNLMWLLDWRGAPETRMPLGKRKLSTCERDTIRSWIREGAKNN